MLDELPGLVMREIRRAEGDPDAQAGLIETQARMLGVSIAVMTHDDDKATDELLMGANQYATEQAASTKQTRRLMEESIKMFGR